MLPSVFSGNKITNGICGVGFEIELEEYTGPLDLLCRLIESGEMEASRIRVSDLIRTYSAYLLEEKGVPIRTISEFISLTARLLLGKVRGLFPPGSATAGEVPCPGGDDADKALRKVLERYRPFRKASELLAEKLVERQKFFLRRMDEDPPIYDFGDLFSLSSLWWELISNKEEQTQQRRLGPTEEMLGFESQDSDFLQVEKRILELEKLIESGNSLSFRSLLVASSSRSSIVVTLLALLEMARMGRLKIFQEERFGELRFKSAV